MSWKRWRKLILTLGLCWLGWVVAMNLILVYFAHDLYGTSSGTNVMPTPLPTSQIADLSKGTTISAFDYTVRIPWPAPLNKLDLKAVSISKTLDGATVMIFDPASQVAPRETYKADPFVENVIGQQAMSSGYQLFQAAMLSSPEQVRFWHTRSSNGRTVVLLVHKTMFADNGTTAIHPISGDHVYGFEAMSAKQGRAQVHLELFDDHDRELELRFVWPQGSASALTQEQINAIVASIQIPSGGCTTPGRCS